jgi:hypothetical protein
VDIFRRINYEKSGGIDYFRTNPNLPMKNSTEKTFALSHAEKKSEDLLMEKMGMSKKEIREVYLKYGVTASRLVELMQLSKYQFVYSSRVAGQCEPCMVISQIKTC